MDGESAPALKQPEFDPVPVPAQIAVLLALTAELFDSVPLDQIKDAEHAVRDAVADIPEEVRKRLDTADKLSDEDRETIIQIAGKSLARFQPTPEAKPEPKPEAKPEPKPEAKPEIKPVAKPGPKPEAKPEPKAKPPAESKPELHPGVKPNANPESEEKS